MMDARSDPYGLAFPVHGVLLNYGVALLDNALLEPLAGACAEEEHYEFMFHGPPAQRGAGHRQSGEPDRDVLAACPPPMPSDANLKILPTLKPVSYAEYSQVIVESGVRIVETAGRNPEPFMPALTPLRHPQHVFTSMPRLRQYLARPSQHWSSGAAKS